MGNMTDHFINYYDILEVDPQATSFEVYQAYLKVKKAYSLRDPQMFKNFSFDEIQELLTLIEEAYSTIGNDETRTIYDAHFFKIHPHLKSKIGVMDFQETAPSVSVRVLAPVENVTHVPMVAAAPLPVSVPTTSPAPAGFGKTPLSSYEVDETFEAQILNQDFFDGVFLGKVRKYKKLKLEDMSQKTCISLKYLYAIEDNNYQALPAAVFTRGYIIQYCKMLGLDADKVVNTFMKLFQNGRE